MKNYVFSKLSGVYMPLTNKTVFQSGTQLNTDAVSSEITLPFPFTMYEKVETKLFISNNGFVTFGAPQTTVTTYAPISSTVTSSAFDNLISGLGNQLKVHSLGTSEISYGLNANNDFVVQFQDVSVLNAPSVKFNFQIVLKSDGETINIVYGNCIGGEVTTRTSQVGIRGKQTPRLDANGQPYATPETKTFVNLSLVNGNWNIFGSGGFKLGTLPAHAMSTRQVFGMVMPQSGLTFEFK